MSVIAAPLEVDVVAPRSRLRWLPGAAAAAVLACWCLALANTGSGAADVARWCLAVVIAVLMPGFALTRAVRRARAPLFEDLAWAAPAGCLVALVGWLLDRMLPVPLGAYVIGPVVTAGLLLIPAARRRVLAKPAPGWGVRPYLVLAAVELVAIGWMLRTGLQAYHPLPGPHGTTYYPDYMYNLALAGELAHHVAPSYPPVAGATLSYHWFLFAITDHLTARTGVGLFDATLRLGPASVVPAAIVLVAVVARRLADRVWAGPLAAVLFGAVELSQATRWSTEDGSLGMMPRAWFTSTPQGLGWVAGLAAAGTVIAFIRRGRADRAVPVALLMPFLILAAGAKSAELAVITGGLVLACVVQLVRRNWPEVRRCAAGVLLCAAVFEGAARTIYAGSSYGVHLRWFAAPLDRMTSMFPGYYKTVTARYLTGEKYDWAAVLTETALWLLPLVPRLAGLVFRLRWRPDAAGWFCAGTALAGIGFAMMLGHPAGSEVYFMQSGYPIGVAGAAGGILLAGERLRGSLPSRRLVRVAAGVAAALVAVGGLAAAGIAFGQPRLSPLNRWTHVHPLLPIATVVPVRHLAWEWLRPTVYLLIVIALAAVAGLVAKGLLGRSGRRVRAPVAGLAALAVALGAGVFDMALNFHGTTVPVQGSPRAVAIDDQGLIDEGALPTMRDAFRAGAYVNAHAGPDDIVATNMYCRFDRAVRQAHLVGCDARNFVASAVTERSTLVGGWAYSDRAVSDAWTLDGVSYKNDPFWDRALFDEQFTAIAHPTGAVLADLYDHHHVRWILVDLRDPPVAVRALDRLATRRFLGPSTGLWQLGRA